MAVIRADAWLVRPTSCSRPRWPAARSPPSPGRGSPAASCPACSTPRARSWRRRSRARSRWSGRSGAVAGVEPAAPADDGRSIRDRLRPWLPVFRGLLIATPILLVFALLFASADAVFAGLVRDALDLPISIDLEDLAGRAVVVLVVAWAAAGLLALGAGRLPLLIPGPSAPPAPPARSLGAASAADLAPGAERWARPRRRPSSSPSTRCSPRSSSSSSPTCSAAATRSRSPG